MTELDHKGPGIISEYRRGLSVGSPVDWIKDLVGPVVALRPECILREFCREHLGGQRIEHSSFCSCITGIHECISSEVISKKH
jgi:hypothetical protein